MAKIAVIFVLIALCSVAMANRIPREEPVSFENLLDSIKKFGDAAKSFIEDEKTQKLFKEIEADGQNLLKAGSDQVGTLLGDLKVKAEELSKDSEGNFKKIAAEVNQSVQELINKNKKE